MDKAGGALGVGPGRADGTSAVEFDSDGKSEGFIPVVKSEGFIPVVDGLRVGVGEWVVGSKAAFLAAGSGKGIGLG